MITPAAIYYSKETCILQADINTTTFSIVIALELHNISRIVEEVLLDKVEANRHRAFSEEKVVVETFPVYRMQFLSVKSVKTYILHA